MTDIVELNVFLSECSHSKTCSHSQDPALQVQYYGSSHGYSPKFLIWSQLVFVIHSGIMYSVAFNYPTPSLQPSKILSFGVLPLKCRNFVYLTPETAHILFSGSNFFSPPVSLSFSLFISCWSEARRLACYCDGFVTHTVMSVLLWFDPVVHKKVNERNCVDPGSSSLIAGFDVI